MFKKMLKTVRYTVAMLADKKSRFFLLLGLYSVVLVLSSFLMPVLFRLIFDVIDNDDPSQLMSVSIGALIIFIATTLIDFYVGVYGNTKSANIIYHTAAKLYTDMHQLPYDIREQNFKEEDILQRIQSGTDSTLALWVMLCNLILSVFVMVVFTVYALHQAVMYSAIILGLVTVSLVRTFLEGKRNAALSASFERIQAEKERTCYDLVKRIEHIAVNGMEKRALDENSRVNDTLWENKRRQLWNQLFFSSVCGTIIESFKPLSLLVFYPLKAVGKITIGQISANNHILSQVENQSGKLNQAYNSIQYCVEPIHRTHELFQNQIRWENNSSNENAPLMRLEHVELTIAGASILRVPDLSIHAGEKVALIGKNGSGKSTLLRMLMGYLRPTGGSVTINGFDPYTKSWSERKQMFSYTPAKPLLYSVSCQDNIDMGSSLSKSVDESILQAFHMERALLEKNAENISEGQKQRINLLRMVLSDAPIRFLDEPTSALDGECAESIMNYLYSNSQTLIFATHNMEHIKYADRVIALSNGEIILDCDSGCEKVQEYFASFTSC